MDEFLAALDDAIEGGTLAQLVLSKPVARGAEHPGKVIVRPVCIRGATNFQWTSQIGKQQLHENLESAEFRKRSAEQVGHAYRDAHLFTTAGNLELRLNRRGKARLSRSPPTELTASTDHNREKSYLIPEGTPCPFLQAIGVMTPSGRVKAKRYAKFRQINRFLELVDDVYDVLPATGTLEIVDFGCGKSYLTFALRHLLVALHGRDVRIVALDRDASVIAACAGIADDLEYADIEFRQGDISAYHADGDVHLTVSLHACDTATDDALVQAVAWESKVILAVPCCQHELNSRMNSEALELLERHGILRERFAALATDALRASALEQAGYRTQVIEFVDLEHTAKNLLIRAIRRTESESGAAGEAARWSRLTELLGVSQLRTDRIASAGSDEPACG